MAAPLFIFYLWALFLWLFWCWLVLASAVWLRYILQVQSNWICWFLVLLLPVAIPFKAVLGVNVQDQCKLG